MWYWPSDFCRCSLLSWGLSSTKCFSYLCFVLKNCLSKAASYYAPFTPVSCDTLTPNSDFMSDLPVTCRNARKHHASFSFLLMPMFSGFAECLGLVLLFNNCFTNVMYYFTFLVCVSFFISFSSYTSMLLVMFLLFYFVFSCSATLAVTNEICFGIWMSILALFLSMGKYFILEH